MIYKVRYQRTLHVWATDCGIQGREWEMVQNGITFMRYRDRLFHWSATVLELCLGVSHCVISYLDMCNFCSLFSFWKISHVFWIVQPPPNSTTEWCSASLISWRNVIVGTDKCLQLKRLITKENTGQWVTTEGVRVRGQRRKHKTFKFITLDDLLPDLLSC